MAATHAYGLRSSSLCTDAKTVTINVVLFPRVNEVVEKYWKNAKITAL